MRDALNTSVSVTVDVPPLWIAVGLNALVIVGALVTTRLTVLLGGPATGVCVVATPEAWFG